jgi:hypothetical protein
LLVHQKAANGVRLAIVQVVQMGQQLVLQSAALASPVHVSALPQSNRLDTYKHKRRKNSCTKNSEEI